MRFGEGKMALESTMLPYAMCGPAFDADATLAPPQASIAVMGAEAEVNAVYANKIAAKPEAERAAYVEELRAAYRADITMLCSEGQRGKPADDPFAGDFHGHTSMMDRVATGLPAVRSAARCSSPTGRRLEVARR